MPREGLAGVAEKVARAAKRRGARQADVWAELRRESSVRVRDTEVEDLQQATARGLGLRVISGGRLGFAYTSDFSPASLEKLVDRALELAKSSASDPANRLPDAKSLKGRHGDQGLLDPKVLELSTEWMIDAAKTMERSGRGVDRRIKTFESVGASSVISEVAIASSEGLVDSYRSSYVELYASPVAQGDDGQLQTGSWVDYRRFFDDLQAPEEVGRKAAERTVRMLGASKGPTCKVPVVMEPTEAASFFGGLVAALNGQRVHQKASFLHDMLDKRIGSKDLSLVDDGLWPRGLGSRPFDGEGLPTRRTALLDHGFLRSFLYDTRTAHKAKAKSTATASRGYQSLPGIGTTTLIAEAHAAVPAAEIVRGVKQGLYVTATLGHGADTITGDYSQGAAGLWIENGELTHPVQEVTIAGNLRGMLNSIDALGDDLELRGRIGAPTIRFGELTVAGA